MVTGLNNSDEWKRLLYETEKAYARAIIASPKGSEQRKQLFAEAYDRVKQITDVYSPGLSETGHTDIVLRIVISLVRRGAAILDVGCAKGDLVRSLIESGFNATGIDISTDYVKKAKEALGSICGEGRICVMDIVNYPSIHHFDVIVMDNVIEHLAPDTIDDVLKKCHAMLKDNGYIILLTPHRFSGPHDISFHFLTLGSKAEGLHLQEFSFTDLEKNLRSAGFRHTLGLGLWPGFYQKYGIRPRPSRWAVKKARLCEAVLERKPFSHILKINRTLAVRIVSILFPGICIGVK
jgi:2-polyprenyl-3-methyl-5-hydroxy-6-metoxy-1,4-benzoquinol methylase